MNESLRIGLLGVSHPHLEGRLTSMRGMSGVEIIGAHDPDPALAKGVAATWGGTAFDSPEALLEKGRADFVIIEGPNRLCTQFATQCAESSTPFLIEKPGAANAQELEALAGVVAKSGVFAQVGYHMRYSPSIVKVREWMQGGVAGRVTTARFHASVMSPWLTDPWFCDPDDRGGLVYLDFCHLLDLLVVLLGWPTKSQATIRKLDDVPDHPFEDSAAFLFEFGDILAAGDCCGWEANDWVTTWDIELYGMEGTIRAGIHPPRAELYMREDREPFLAGWNITDHARYDGILNYRRELEDIVARVQTGRAPGGATLEDALGVAHLLESLYLQNGL